MHVYLPSSALTSPATKTTPQYLVKLLHLGKSVHQNACGSHIRLQSRPHKRFITEQNCSGYQQPATDAETANNPPSTSPLFAVDSAGPGGDFTPDDSAQVARSRNGTAAVQFAEQAAVPWGWQKTVQVSIMWMFVFFLGHYAAAFAVEVASGRSPDELPSLGRALYHLVMDVFNLTASIKLLESMLAPWWSTAAQRLFRFELKPYWKWRNVLLCCVMFPVLLRLSEAVQHSPTFNNDEQLFDLQTVLGQGHKFVNTLYFLTLTILSPLWEEIVFRGFFQSSLRRYLPPPYCILVSAIAFTYAHVYKPPSLFLLGIVLGSLYEWSGNLAHPLLLHALWNLMLFLRCVVAGGL